MRIFTVVTILGGILLFHGLAAAQEEPAPGGSWRSFDATSTGSIRTAPFHPPVAVESSGALSVAKVEHAPEATGVSTGAQTSLSGAVPELAARQMRGKQRD